jgi:hypothetical protein
MSYLTAVVIFVAFMTLVVAFTFTGDDVHEDDKHVPAYRQRIIIGRGGRGGHAPRWRIWLTYSVFPLILIAIVLSDP